MVACWWIVREISWSDFRFNRGPTTEQSKVSALTILLHIYYPKYLPLASVLPSLSSGRVNSCLRSRWRSLFVPRSSVLPLRSLAGRASYSARRIPRSNDRGIGIPTCSLWAWELLVWSGEPQRARSLLKLHSLRLGLQLGQRPAHGASRGSEEDYEAFQHSSPIEAYLSRAQASQASSA